MSKFAKVAAEFARKGRAHNTERDGNKVSQANSTIDRDDLVVFEVDVAKFMKARQKLIIYVGEIYEHMAKIFEDGADINPDHYKPRYPFRPIDPIPSVHGDDVPNNEQQRLNRIVERQIESNRLQHHEDVQIYERELTESKVCHSTSPILKSHIEIFNRRVRARCALGTSS